MLLKNIVIGVVLVFFVFILYQKGIALLKSSDYFIVRDIVYDPSLKFMDAEFMAGLKGKNLFNVDLKKIERQLQMEYPRFSQLRILKKFPNQILVVASTRAPFAQTRINGKIAILDDEGAVVALSADLDTHLPLVTGVRLSTGKITIGSPMQSIPLSTALAVVKAFRAEATLAAYRISKIDVANLSQIYFYITEDLKVILDEDDLGRELKILGLVLSQTKNELENVRYIDLRFKEPVLGKK